MGLEISTNFTAINHVFNLDAWKVFTATHKATGKPVSIWSLEAETLQRRFPKKADRDAFFDLAMCSINQMRKLDHPNILKIYSVVENKPELAFAAEPVHFCVGDLKNKLDPMEAGYIASQVADTVAFLHQRASIIHLGICPTAVAFDESLNVKLCHFQWSVGLPSPEQKSVSERIISRASLSDLQYKAPEILEKKPVTQKADVFALGLFIYYVFTGQDLNTGKSPEDILTAWPTRVCARFDVPDEVNELLRRCLVVNPMSRADIMEISDNYIFRSMQIAALRFLDSLETQSDSEKRKFFEKLCQRVGEFSPRLQQRKIFPALMQYCKDDVNLGASFIVAALEIGKNMERDVFVHDVWDQIRESPVLNEPGVMVAFLRNIEFVFEKIDRSLHKSLVYPVIATCISSPDPKIQQTLLEVVPVITSQMKERHVRWVFLPQLVDMLAVVHSSNVVRLIRTIRETLTPVDHDSFALECLPKVRRVWNKNKSAELAGEIMKLLGHLNSDIGVMLTAVVPIASAILGSGMLDQNLSERCVDWIIELMNEFKTARLTSPGNIKAISSMAGPQLHAASGPIRQAVPSGGVSKYVSMATFEPAPTEFQRENPWDTSSGVSQSQDQVTGFGQPRISMAVSEGRMPVLSGKNEDEGQQEMGRRVRWSNVVESDMMSGTFDGH